MTCRDAFIRNAWNVNGIGSVDCSIGYVCGIGGQSIAARGGQAETLKDMAVGYEISCPSKSGKILVTRRRLYRVRWTLQQLKILNTFNVRKWHLSLCLWLDGNALALQVEDPTMTSLHVPLIDVPTPVQNSLQSYLAHWIC